VVSIGSKFENPKSGKGGGVVGSTLPIPHKFSELSGVPIWMAKEGLKQIILSVIEAVPFGKMTCKMIELSIEKNKNCLFSPELKFLS
jgi:hypothetical protein